MISRMRRNALFFAILATLVALPAIASAGSGRYRDVDASNEFTNDIEWLADNGITRGCAADEFCPGAEVKREQLAAFLHRLATSGVVDAGTLNGYTAEQLMVGGAEGIPGPAGERGPKGEPGAPGEPGAQGEPGVGFMVDCATDQIAQWDGEAWACSGALADLQDQIDALTASLAGHVGDTLNPHEVTKAQVGLGNVVNTKSNMTATTYPGPTDDADAGYSVGSTWVNTTNGEVFVMVDSTVGLARWQKITNATFEQFECSSFEIFELTADINVINPSPICDPADVILVDGAYPGQQRRLSITNNGPAFVFIHPVGEILRDGQTAEWVWVGGAWSLLYIS